MALREVDSWFHKIRLLYRKLLYIHSGYSNKRDIKIVIFSASGTILVGYTIL